MKSVKHEIEQPEHHLFVRMSQDLWDQCDSIFNFQYELQDRNLANFTFYQLEEDLI